ncbi:hypothetical protein NIES4071_42850 [Calothrix sp. NIES-4071]|nr:hypothetical protein NIES4071_42850 [Calothrix sp. NIES-4071]BAZ58599.1 hypothetical protein NIES4105_42780 [Calothrix sp. NIES-4105]
MSAYVDSKGQSVGYSVDMLVQIKEQLEKQLGFENSTQIS